MGNTGPDSKQVIIRRADSRWKAPACQRTDLARRAFELAPLDFGVPAPQRQGLSNGKFVLYHQPKVDIRRERIFGTEALIRWQHPEKGLASPAEFLPLAENTKLCQNLDLWVLETAIRQLDDWFASGTPLSVNLNISARLLQTADFMDRRRDLLNRHANVPSTALQHIDHVSRLMHECQQLGVQFALDNFGTGYSSLFYIKYLPVQTQKIDRCFVGDTLTDEENRTMVQGVIGLAQALRRHVIAAGAETVAHGVTLLQLGGELAQGHCPTHACSRLTGLAARPRNGATP